MTHAELVSAAARWLANRGCSVVLTEVKAAKEIPDAVGWSGRYGTSTLVECKVSRADFRADAKKSARLHGGVGYSRFYLAPEGVLKLNDIPKGWGFLEYKMGKVHLRRASQPFSRRDRTKETRLLISAIRRIGQDVPQGVSVRAYKYPTKNTATVGVADDSLMRYACDQWLRFATAYCAAVQNEGALRETLESVRGEIAMLMHGELPE